MRIGPYYVVIKLRDLIPRDCDAIAIFDGELKLVIDKSDYRKMEKKIGEYIGIGYHFEVNE